MNLGLKEFEYNRNVLNWNEMNLGLNEFQYDWNANWIRMKWILGSITLSMIRIFIKNGMK